MPTISTIPSPAVEVREFDESLRAVTSSGTTVFIPGFASQGPVEEINPIGTMADFETIYGQPTNAAERYFYYTVKAVIDNSGAGTTVLTSRIPYGAGDGDNVSNAFTLLAYPAIPVIKDADNDKGFDHHKIDEKKVASLLTLKDVTNREITPTKTSHLMILNSQNVSREITINSISFASEDEHLPSLADNAVNYTTQPVIKYQIAGISGALSAKGALSVEAKGNDYLVHLAFALKANENTQIGVLTLDATYTQESFGNNDIDTISFKGDSVNVKPKYIPAFKPGKFYSQPQDPDATTDDYSDVTYLIGAPVTYQISLNEYYELLSGELFGWANTPYEFGDITNAPATDSEKFGMFNALKHSAFIALNPSRTIINDSFEGYYFGLTDNLFNQSEDGHTYNAVKSLKITTLNSEQCIDGKGLTDNRFQSVNKGRLDFYLDSNNKGSISQVIQNEIVTFDNSGTDYDDTLNLGLFKIKKSTTSSEVMKLTYALVEKYNASFGRTRQYSVSNSTEPKTYFVENILEDSMNLTVLVNPFIAENIYVDIDNKLRGKVRVFSSKLLTNMERYERKYITNYFSDPSANNPNKQLMQPIRLAESNIKSWADIVARAGVSLELINEYGLGDMFVGGDYAMFALSDSLYPFGTYTVNKTSNKYIGSLPTKLERILNIVSNDEQYPDIDIICEGGLSTVYVYSNTSDILNEANTALNTVAEGGLTSGAVSEDSDGRGRNFDDTLILNGIEDLRTGRSSYSEYAQNVVEDYMAVQNAFLKIANSETNGGRGNTFYIADILRGVLIKGKNTKVSNLFGSRLSNNSYDDTETVNHSWSTSIYYPVKHLTDSYVSSFTSLYNQYFKILDGFSGEKVWIPASGFIAGRMCAVDQLTGPWEAAAGLNRGGVPGVLDVAVSPTLSQRSDLYKICVNSIPNLPNVGPTIWGIRTMSKKASAFDQNTCRRTFLYIEKVIKQTLRYFIFERNDSYTQLQVFNEIEPFLDSLKKQRAIYSYRLVCDSTNNTEEIVNNGDMVVDVAAAPERTAENIILNVTANRYTQTVESTTSGS